MLEKNCSIIPKETTIINSQIAINIKKEKYAIIKKKKKSLIDIIKNWQK